MRHCSRREFVQGSLALASLGLVDGCTGRWPATAPRRKGLRIGYLALEPTRFDEIFRQGLRELGYVEGENIAIVWRWADGRPDRLPELADELVRLDLDLLVARATLPALAAKQATATLPVVFSTVTDPVGSRLVASLARPGGNVTGVSNSVRGIHGKRVALLKDAVPTASRIAALGDPDSSPTWPITWQETQEAAQRLGMQLQLVQARGPDEFEGAFAAIERAGADALLVVPSGAVYLNRRAHIAEFAARARLPSMYEAREWVEAGGLLAYGVDLPSVSRSAANYVDKVLKGAKPADLPVEQPTTFELVINVTTARALDFTIPRSIQIQITDVIQ